MKVLISRTNIELINNLYTIYNEYEVGGVLLGKRKGKDILITHIISNINTDDLRRDKYVRKITNIKESMIEIIKKSNYEIDYIGEWHTHIGTSSMFSSMDKKAMTELNEDFPELILLIKSKDIISTFLFAHRNIKKLIIEVMEVFE